MDPETLKKTIESFTHTNVTKTVRKEPYPAISPTRPELSQAGKVILIPGGGTGVGKSIARAFVQASAETVIIIGRRDDVLKTTATELEGVAKTAGTKTKIVHRQLDVTKQSEVEAFWKELAAQGVFVDVWIANAAKFTEFKPLLTLGADEVWSQVETNAKSPLYFAEKFYAQKGDKQKFIVNVSTGSIHVTAHPIVQTQPAYTFSKATSTLLFQLLAQDTPREKVLVTSYHPGTVYADGWKKMGVPPEWLDHDDLCGQVAVWLATKQAEFLHGRYIWASWDVDELSKGEVRKRIEDDYYFLRLSIVGLNGGSLV